MARDRTNYKRGGKNGQHGGARQGQPGKNYPNRTDMQTNRQNVQAPRAATGQPYGVAGQQLALQQAVPLPAGPPIVPLSAPTQRPSEPVTAGMQTGPGPGPEVLPNAQLTPELDLRSKIAALFRATPNSDLRRLLATIDARRPMMFPAPPPFNGPAPTPAPPSPTAPPPGPPITQQPYNVAPGG